MKNVLIKLVIALIGAGASAAFASTAGIGSSEDGLLIWAFIGFGVMLIMLQAVPALILFVGMLKGLFSSPDKHATLTKH